PTPRLCTLSLHDALPILTALGNPSEALIPVLRGLDPVLFFQHSRILPAQETGQLRRQFFCLKDLIFDRSDEGQLQSHCLIFELGDRKSTRLNSSHVSISY